MRPSLIQRLIAALLLLTYLVTGTTVLPAMVALAADCGGGHQLRISQSEHGLQLTLRHDGQGYTPKAADHCNALTRTVVHFCAPTREGDHRFSSDSFDSSTGSEREHGSRAAKQAPVLNQAATLQLCLTQVHPVRTVARMTGRQDRPSPLTSRLPELSTVRLRI